MNHTTLKKRKEGKSRLYYLKSMYNQVPLISHHQRHRRDNNIDQIQLIINTSTKGHTEINVPSDIKIYSLKHEINHKCILFYNGIELENHKTLKDYNIESFSELTMRLPIKLTIDISDILPFVPFQINKSLYTIKCDPTMSISQILMKVASNLKIGSIKHKIDHNECILVYNGKELENDKTLKENNIESFSELNMKLIIKLTIDISDILSLVPFQTNKSLYTIQCDSTMSISEILKQLNIKYIIDYIEHTECFMNKQYITKFDRDETCIASICTYIHQLDTIKFKMGLHSLLSILLPKGRLSTKPYELKQNCLKRLRRIISEYGTFENTQKVDPYLQYFLDLRLDSKLLTELIFIYIKSMKDRRQKTFWQQDRLLQKMLYHEKDEIADQVIEYFIDKRLFNTKEFVVNIQHPIHLSTEYKLIHIQQKTLFDGFIRTSLLEINDIEHIPYDINCIIFNYFSFCVIEKFDIIQRCVDYLVIKHKDIKADSIISQPATDMIAVLSVIYHIDGNQVGSTIKLYGWIEGLCILMKIILKLSTLFGSLHLKDLSGLMTELRRLMGIDKEIEKLCIVEMRKYNGVDLFKTIAHNDWWDSLEEKQKVIAMVEYFDGL